MSDDPKQEIVDKLKAQAPTAATSAVVALLVALAVTGGKDAAPPDAPELVVPATVKDPDAPQVRPRTSQEGDRTRLVSCGDSNAARIAGDDTGGSIALGTGANGACTLLFAAPWPVVPTCAVAGGGVAAVTVARVTASELVVTGAGDSFSYRCGVAE